MFEVIRNETLAPSLHRMEIHAPRIAAARQAGQFVIVRAAIDEERIPLTIGDADPQTGTITLFIQAIGASTRRIVAVPAGGALRDVAGPLGMATEMERWGRVACVGGGVGTAVLYPMAKALAQIGNEVTTIIGGRSAQYIILADELAVFSAAEILPKTVRPSRVHHRRTPTIAGLPAVGGLRIRRWHGRGQAARQPASGHRQPQSDRDRRQDVWRLPRRGRRRSKFACVTGGVQRTPGQFHTHRPAHHAVTQGRWGLGCV
jgi:hypothetical protein